MGSLKLQSFEDFSNASAKAAKIKLEEEQSAARDASAYEFKTLLSKFGVTRIKDLNEEDRNKFFRKLGASEVSESLAVIEEGTRSQVGIISKRGKIESVYMHYDGYPDHMLPTIKKGYMNSGTVKFLLKKGGGSGLEADPSKINFYGDKTTLKGDAKKIEDYIRDASDRAGAEYVYLFDERDGKWYMADVYGDQELIPAFESLIINERFVPSKGNLRDAKKVKKALEQFFTNHNALMDQSIFLGVCKYLLAESLTDANFHSYREPVSKVIKGKLSTVFVEIDGLNNMKIPVGKKSIITLLDEVGPFMASAAGWSGIGIVEGMALFLDSFGNSDLAQKIVDEFNLIFQNESVVNEGNAFLAARAKAIEEDAEEFEFNGKKFPVIKEEEEVTEDEIEIKVDGEYEIEVEKEDEEEESEEEAPAEEVEEGNAFGAARAEAIAKGEDKFKVGDEEFDVESVDAEDKENAEEFADEEGIEVKEEEETEVSEAKFKVGQYIKSKKDSDRFNGDVYDRTNDVDGSEILKNSSFEIYEIGKDEVVLWSDADQVEYSIDPDDLKHFVKESVVTEAKFVKDYEGDVLNAETEEEILEVYPDAKFYVGKMSHFFGELMPNLFFKAYYAKYYKQDTGKSIKGDFKITSIYSQKGSNYQYLFNESAQPTNEAEVKSDEEFKEYAFSVLGQAFGDKFDEEKAQEVVDGLLDKHGDDYGAAVGALQSSLG